MFYYCVKLLLTHLDSKLKKAFTNNFHTIFEACTNIKQIAVKYINYYAYN